MNTLIMSIIASSVLVMAEPEKAVVDWDKAYAHAKTGKTVRLTLIEVTTANNESFDVYLKEGRKETLVGSASFHINGPADFALSATDVLAKMRKAPSDRTQIYLKTKAAKIEMKSFKVELLP